MNKKKKIIRALKAEGYEFKRVPNIYDEGYSYMFYKKPYTITIKPVVTNSGHLIIELIIVAKTYYLFEGAVIGWLPTVKWVKQQIKQHIRKDKKAM